MKKLITILLLSVLPLSLMAEKRVSKIYDAYLNETQHLTYDDEGRLVRWTVIHDEGDYNRTLFDHSFEYVSKDRIIITGMSDCNDAYIEVTLNEDGLVKIATDISGNTQIALNYDNGIMSECTWCNLNYPDEPDITVFDIVNGNPERLISDYWEGEYPEITYSDKPNYCGLVYMPMITCNTAWRYRSLAYAGLQGKGSTTLPSSCRFWLDKPTAPIEYQFDEDGYVTYMKVENANDGDGEFYFYYCEVNSVQDVEVPSVSVIGRKGGIDIEGEYTSLKIYNLQGLVCSPEGLTPGIYIVDVDGSIHKTVVY